MENSNLNPNRFFAILFLVTTAINKGMCIDLPHQEHHVAGNPSSTAAPKITEINCPFLSQLMTQVETYLTENPDSTTLVITHKRMSDPNALYTDCAEIIRPQNFTKSISTLMELVNQRSIEKLVLRLSPIESNDISVIAKALMSNPTLTSLEIQCDPLYQSTYADDIAQLLKNNRILTSFRLITGISGEAASKILGALKENTTLTDLRITCTENQGTFANEVSNILLTNTSLRSLDIVGSKIGHEGATKIAKALQTNTTLESLNLGVNSIGDEGATKIAEALQSNTSLRRLSLGLNSIGDEGTTKILEALQSNTSLNHLELPCNKISEAVVTKIREALKRNT